MGRHRPSEFFKYITGDPVHSTTGLSTYSLANWPFQPSGPLFNAMVNYFWPGEPVTVDKIRWVLENVLLPINQRFFIYHQFLSSGLNAGHYPRAPSVNFDLFEEYDMPTLHRLVKGQWGRDEQYFDEYVAQETTIDPRIVTVNGGKNPYPWPDIEPDKAHRYPWTPYSLATLGRNFCKHGYAIEIPEAGLTDFEEHFYTVDAAECPTDVIAPSVCSDVHPHLLQKLINDYLYLDQNHGFTSKKCVLGGYTTDERNGAYPQYGLGVNFSLWTMEEYTKSAHFASETDMATGQHYADNSPCALHAAFVAKTTTFDGETTVDVPPLADDIIAYHFEQGVWHPTWGWIRWIEEKIVETMVNFAIWWETQFDKRFYWGNEFTFEDIVKSEPIMDARTINSVFGYTGALDIPPTEHNPGWAEDDAKQKLDWFLFRAGYGSIIMNLLGAPGSNSSAWPNAACGGAANNGGMILPDEIKRQYLITVPIIANALIGEDYQSCRLCDFDFQRWSRYFGYNLSKMRYYGGYVGHEKEAVKVLMFDPREYGDICPQFLTHSLDILTVKRHRKYTIDYDLDLYGDLSEFDVIFLWVPGALTDASAELQQKIRDFLSNGGALVVPSGSHAAWIDEILSQAGMTTMPLAHPIYEPFTDLTEYQGTVSEGQYGTGIVIEIQFPSGRIGLPTDTHAQNIGGTPRDNFVTLLSNAIMYAANPARTDLPAMFLGIDTIFRRRETGFNDRTRFSVCGKGNGEPVLIWISNEDATPCAVNMNLNTEFFGLTDFVAVDVNEWNMAKASPIMINGKTFIRLELTVPVAEEDNPVDNGGQRGGWMPVYVCPLPPDKNDVYCNGFVVGKNIGVNVADFSIKAANLLPVFLVVNSSLKPNMITVNGLDLVETDRTTLNNRDTDSGWFYDQDEGLLIIKFSSQPSTTPNAVNVAYGPVVTHELTIQDTTPQSIPIIVDGTPIDETPKTLTVLEGTHTPEVPQEVIE